MQTISHHHRAGIVQAQRIAQRAYANRVTQPVQAFKQWELASSLLRLAHLAAGIEPQPVR